MSRIVVVRHGNTFAAADQPRRIGARTDPDLTATGREQAGALGRHFARQGMAFDRALAGPLRRTCRTAQLVLAAFDSPPPLERAPWLLEIDHGVDEGSPEDRVIARVGQAALHAWDSRGIPPAGWLVDPDRRREDWSRFFRSRPSGDTLVVTSNGVARFALLAAFAAVPLASLRLRTGAFGIIEQASDGALRLDSWDQRP